MKSYNAEQQVFSSSGTDSFGSSHSGTKLMQVELEGFVLVAGPDATRKESEYNAGAGVSDERTMHRLAIEKGEIQRKQLQKLESTEEGGSWADGVAARIFENLILTFKDVHIRYEHHQDHIEAACKSFATGLTIKEIKVQKASSTNKSCSTDPSGMMYKVAHLQAFAVYWTPNAIVWDSLSEDELLAKMLSSIAIRATETPPLMFLLQPLDFGLQIATRHSQAAEEPSRTLKMSTSCDLPLFELTLSKEQYAGAIVFCVSLFSRVPLR